LHVDERDARSPRQSVRILTPDQIQIGTATGICDLVIPDTAATLAHYSSDVFYEDYATLTRNHFGQGYAYYCGAGLDQAGLSYLLQQINTTAGLPLGAMPAVEITTRATEHERFTFIINTSDQPQFITNQVPTAKTIVDNG